MTLEQVLTFVETKEAGKRSAARLLLPQATDQQLISEAEETVPPRQEPRTKKLAHTVAPKAMEKTLQPESGDPNALPLVPTVGRITTLKRFAGTRIAQIMKTLYLTRYVD